MRLMLVLLMIAVATAWTGAQDSQAASFKYRGIVGCTKSCHKKEKDGDQKSIWEESKHAKAYETLATPKAKETAAKVGVKGDPQKADECLICHTTGFGEPKKQFNKRFKIEDGVQCEACHGPGDKYRKKKTMRQIAEERGPDNKNPSATAKKTGLIFPTADDCKVCHAKERSYNGKTFKNINYKDFDFDEYYEKIKHPTPAGAGGADDTEEEEEDDDE